MPRRKQTFPKENHITKQQIPQKKIKMAQNPLILHLNDDCLWYIFSYFDLPELLNAGSVCQRFEGIAQMFYKNYPSVNFTSLSLKFYQKGMSRPTLSEMFRKLEPHLAAMRICGGYDTMFGRDIFSTSIFSNLQHLFMSSSFNIREEYANVFPALKQIFIYNVPLRDEGVVNRWFKNSPHLKILKFSDLDDMTGRCLVGLKGIEELKIYACDNLQEEFFEQFCQMNPQLKKLTLDFDMILDPDNQYNFLWIINKFLKNLESLVISHNMYENHADYGILRDLPKVTKLRLDIDDTGNTSEFLQMFENFATNSHIEFLTLRYVSKDKLDRLQQFPYLKVLKLDHGSDYSITFDKLSKKLSNCSATLEELHLFPYTLKSPDGLKEFIKQFKKLKLLNVCGYKFFTSAFLMDIEDCLYNRSQMFEIAVNGTPLVQELQKKPISDILKDFLDRTKEILKLTIDAFHNDGIPKKSFHEWDEWEAEQEY